MYSWVKVNSSKNVNGQPKSKSTLKVNDQRCQDWEMTSADDKTQMTARADMAELFGACSACEAVEMARELVQRIPVMCGSAWAIRWSQFFSENVDRRKTSPMVATTTRLEQPWWGVKRIGDLAENLIGAWQRLDSQIRMFWAALCRAIEKLHYDMRYVLIEGQKWQIRWWQWSWR